MLMSQQNPIKKTQNDLPVMSTPGFDCESSHFMSVFRQLFVAGHALSVNDVDDGVLGANPNFILDQSQHAILNKYLAYVSI